LSPLGRDRRRVCKVLWKGINWESVLAHINDWNDEADKEITPFCLTK
jgi:hypothetical protein